MRRKSPILSIVVLISLLISLLSESAPADAAPPRLDLHAYPVVPVMRGAVATRVRTIVRVGRKYGNRARVFSKVGDSVTDWVQFLNPVGTGGLRLGSYTNLQGVVNWYLPEIARTKNSFANLSMAARGSWTSGSLLHPGGSFDISVCGTAETPLDCELRVTRPAVALIMIGTNDLPHGDLNAFAGNLDRILWTCENRGVVPVLSTIPYRKDHPDLFNRVGAYNEVIVRVAQAHNIPLWNYWLAMESLPYHGISGDNVHPSIPQDGNTAIFDPDHLTAGFTMRNLTALQVLNSLLPLLR